MPGKTQKKNDKGQNIKTSLMEALPFNHKFEHRVYSGTNEATLEENIWNSIVFAFNKQLKNRGTSV